MTRLRPNCEHLEGRPLLASAAPTPLLPPSILALAEQPNLAVDPQISADAQHVLADFIGAIAALQRAERPYLAATVHASRAISAAAKHLPTRNQVNAALASAPLTNTNPPVFDAAQESADLSSLGVPARLIGPYITATERANAAAWKVLPGALQPLAADLNTILHDEVQAGVVEPGDPLYQQGSRIIADIQSGNYLALTQLSNNT